jgi:class 3 adenylate cyclase
MIDPVDPAVRAAVRVAAASRETGDQVLITEDTRRRLRTPGSEPDERNAVELKGKQVHVELWALRAHPVDASFRDGAGASVSV